MSSTASQMTLVSPSPLPTSRKQSVFTLVDQNSNNEGATTNSVDTEPNFLEFEPHDSENPYNWGKVGVYFYFLEFHPSTLEPAVLLQRTSWLCCSTMTLLSESKEEKNCH